MGPPVPPSHQPKAVRAAAAKAASRGRRSALRRWASVATSKVAWLIILLVAVYLGFFYRPRVLRYRYEILGGPGLDSAFSAPTRHFRVAVRNDDGRELPTGFKRENVRLTWSISPSVPERFGQSVVSEVYDIGEGEFRVAFRVKQGVPSGHELRLRISYVDKQTHISISPLDISIPGPLHEPSCNAPVEPSVWTQAMGCPHTFPQLEEDLKNFEAIDLAKLRQAIPKLLERSSATSLLHYVVKDNQVFKKAHGPFPAFSYFADMVLHQLAATVKLPDVEFVLNVGDWPLVGKSWGEERIPVFSWCGSNDSFDMVLPQWDVSRSTILGNSDSNPDLLASQGWGLSAWESRDPRAAFRGRDSNPVRVKLAQLSALHPNLLDVAITSWENDENFEAEEQLGGGSKKFIKLPEFPKYKYILQLDGTVAAYRNPYLIASGSLLMKQDSVFYEWYQRELSPWEHYVPFDGTGEDLLSKLQWAKEHDMEAQRIAANARQYAKTNLLPERVLCFYYKALESYAKRQIGTPNIKEDMIWVPPHQLPKYNTCGSPDPQSLLGDYPVVPLHPSSEEAILSQADKDAVVVVYSAFCNKSARILADILIMARMYKAAGADLLFASAETFTVQHPIKWIQATNGPKLFFLRARSSNPEQLDGQLTVTAAVSFINSKLQNVQHHIRAPPELEQVVSDPIPEKNDGPVKQIVASTFEKHVLSPDKDVLLMVSAPWCGYCKKIRPAFFRFARAAAADPAAAAALDVAKMNGPTNEIRHPGFTITHYPTIWFIRKGETEPIIFSGSSTEEGFLTFVKKHATEPAELEGIVTPPKAATRSNLSMKYLQSQTGSPILSIDSDGFYENVLDSEKDVLLLVYAPWCGHCKKLEPIYEEFAKLAAESKSASEALVVAKMDGAANRLPDEKYQVTGYPTVWFFKKGSDTPIKFMGDRTVRGLASFVQLQSSVSIDFGSA